MGYLGDSTQPRSFECVEQGSKRSRRLKEKYRETRNGQKNLRAHLLTLGCVNQCMFKYCINNAFHDFTNQHKD